MGFSKGSWLGFLAGVLTRLRRHRSEKITSEDLKKHDHSTSTQRLGIRFTEHIRDTFRFRWLKKH